MFFRSRDYLEVDTAALSPSLIPESSLEREYYLIPSPELWMKRLIAAGSGSVFQICKSFRNSEPSTDIHNPEFTMLEWYTLEADYLESIDTTEQLFTHLISGLPREPVPARGNRRVDCSPPFLRLSMAEAFADLLKVDLGQLIERGREALAEVARGIGLSVTPEDREEDLFHKIFLGAVEPHLSADRALILYDYPALIPTLARRKPGSPWAERWELYVAGVEVANCYSEETDLRAHEEFYDIQGKAKRDALVPHPSDRGLLGTIGKRGLPGCSGVALGIERLFMLLLGQDSIGPLLPFGAFSP
jgi:lysyl-tRNA synthetase class 2